ncbi:MAG: hypothetical protein WCS73_08010 [Lentisphaeria bacterium]
MNFKNNAETEICHTSAGWSCWHDTAIAGGPLRLEQSGSCVLRNYARAQDDMTEELLVMDKARVFRKGGAAVFQSRGHFPFGAENIYLQTIRYAGNTARVTHDIRWHAGAELAHQLQLGSVELPGKWTAVRLVILADDGTIRMSLVKLDADAELHFSPQPLAVVFIRADGFMVEFGLGNDLWRWQNGLEGDTVAGSLTLKNEPAQLRITRTVAEVTGKEAVQPVAREYRFGAYFAWSSPLLQQTAAVADDRYVRLIIEAKKGVVGSQLQELGENPRVILHLSDLKLPRQALRSIDGCPCWESKITQKFFRRTIRQLAGVSLRGSLVIDGGMYPGLCCDGIHCNRKKDCWHWDIVGILDACSWMRQCLGDDWTIGIPQTEPWTQLPSLSCLGCANGFRVSVDKELEDTDCDT